MTIQEMRVRLKHCAGLLYGISSDLNTDLEKIEDLERRNAELENELATVKASGAYKRAKARERYTTPEQKQKHVEAMKRYWERKLGRSADSGENPKKRGEESGAGGMP